MPFKRPLKLAPYLETLSIIDKEAMVRRFPIRDDFAWAQRELVKVVEDKYNAGEPVRTIVLKARQLGISTVTEGIIFLWLMFHQGMQGLVVAHQGDASQGLFEKTQFYWESWPFKPLFHVRHASQKRFMWDETRSGLRIASAKNVEAPRGRTLHCVHLSECAFYDEPELLMVALNQTVPKKHGTFICLESTANGAAGWFYEFWMESKAGGTKYVPMFFPWFRHPEYRYPTTLCSRLELTTEERRLLDLGADYENIEWRRQVLPTDFRHDEQYFNQEMPATDTDAFIVSGTPVFPLEALMACYEPQTGFRGMLIDDGGRIRFEPDQRGPLTIYKAPAEDADGTLYFVSGDPSQTTYGDPACIQVINRATFEQVATWHGHIDPVSFAGEMIKLGYWYKTAMLCPEVSGGGQATIAAIIERDYPSIWHHRWADKSQGKVSQSLGWESSWKRKDWAIGRACFMIGERAITLHDEITYMQMRGFVTHAGGYQGNVDKKLHDDAVMALVIALTASGVEGPYRGDSGPVYNEAEELYAQFR
jgi:hypothetical protein